MSQLNLELSILDKLFPFFFVADKQGGLIAMGPSIKKLLSDRNKDIFFDDIFEVTRPAKSDFRGLLEKASGEMIVLKMRKPKSEMMGQVMDLANSQYKLFIVNLVVQDADELTHLNLDFNDFAIHDPIFDYLMLLQTQKRAIKQADESNQKMAEAHRIAVKASETKSRFLANMSHELRTPMNGILGMASILQDTELNDEQKDYVQTLITSGEAMLGLVNDILDLSKIEAGHIELNNAPVNLNELIKEIENTVHPTIVKKNLKLDVNMSAAVPETILADRVRLRQVMLNLIGNAVKFTSSGTVAVTFDVHGENEDKTLYFSVKDSGIGMSQETLSQLFSPFVQGDSSMTKKFEGTGLGLSICKRLIEAMDGNISVKSTLGQGSEFMVTIKLVGAK